MARLWAVLRLALLGTIVGVAACVIVLVALRLGWQRERLRAAVELRAGLALEGELSIGALDGPLFPSFTLRDVTFRRPEAAGLSVRLARLHVSYGLRELLSDRTLVLEQIEFGPGDLQLEGDPRGASSGDAEETMLPFAIELRGIALQGIRVRTSGLAEGLLEGRLSPVRIERDLEVIPPERLQISVAAEFSDLAALSRALEIEPAPSGRARLEAALEGPLVRPAIRGELVVESLAVEAAQLDRVSFEIGSTPDRLEAQGEVVAFGRRVASTHASVPYTRLLDLPRAFEATDAELTLDADDFDAALLAPFLPAEISSPAGRLDLELRVRGGSSRPALSGTLVVRQGSVHVKRLGETLRPIDARLVLDGERLRIESLRVAAAALGSAQLEGVITGVEPFGPATSGPARSGPATSARVELRVAAELEDLARLSSLFSLEPPLAGAASLEANLAGALANLSRLDFTGAVNLRGRELALGATTLGELALRARAPHPRRVEVEQLALSGGELEIEAAPFALDVGPRAVSFEPVALRVAGFPLALSGTVDADGLRDVRVRGSGLELSAIPPALLSGMKLDGRLHASIALDGPFARPRIQGAVVVEPLAIDAAVAERVRLTIESVDQRLRAIGFVEAFGRVAAQTRIDVPYVGAAGLVDAFAAPDAELELTATDFDLALLAPFLPRSVVSPKGQLDLALLARGGTAAPDVSGELRIRGGSVIVPFLGQQFAPIEAELRLNGDALRVEKLRVGAGEGFSSAEGVVRLQRGVPTAVDAVLRFERFGVSRAAIAALDLNGEASLSGPVDAPSILGNVVLRNARARVPDARDPLLREIRVVGQSRVGGSIREGGVDPLARARLQLHVEVPRNTWITGRGAELEVAGKLALRKAPGGPYRYSGGLEVVRGTYKLGGRVLNVDRGTLALSGAADLDPSIDLEARTRVGETEIVLTLSGRLSNPTLQLSSTPPLEQGDILALLFLGRPLASLESGQASGIQSAIAQLGGEFALDQLRARAGGWLPIDTAGFGPAADGSGPKLEVGRYFGENLFVRYGKSFGAEPTDEVVIEYRVSPSVRVESRTGTDGTAGADVIWSRDY